MAHNALLKRRTDCRDQRRRVFSRFGAGTSVQLKVVLAVIEYCGTGPQLIILPGMDHRIDGVLLMMVENVQSLRAFFLKCNEILHAMFLCLSITRFSCLLFIQRRDFARKGAELKSCSAELRQSNLDDGAYGGWQGNYRTFLYFCYCFLCLFIIFTNWHVF